MRLAAWQRRFRMGAQKRFISFGRPTTRTLLWGSVLVGLLVTLSSGWSTPVWDGVWAYVGIPVGLLRKVLLVGALTFVVLLIVRELIERSPIDNREPQ